jgi:hypothetical protein
MIKQKTTYKISSTERATLIICSIIMAAFVLFVSLATQGSLAFYTILHAMFTFFTIIVLLAKDVSSTVVRTAVVFGVLGAASAIFLVLAYLPYYMSYLEYSKSIQ